MAVFKATEAKIVGLNRVACLRIMAGLHPKTQEGIEMKWLLGFVLLFAGCGPNPCDEDGVTKIEQEIQLELMEAAVLRAQECPACTDISAVTGQLILADFPSGDVCFNFLADQIRSGL